MVSVAKDGETRLKKKQHERSCGDGNTMYPDSVSINELVCDVL